MIYSLHYASKAIKTIYGWMRQLNRLKLPGILARPKYAASSVPPIMVVGGQRFNLFHIFMMSLMFSGHPIFVAFWWQEAKAPQCCGHLRTEAGVPIEG